MDTTPDLGIPYVAGQQAQPEVTHNEAISLIQALLNGVVSRAVNTPPGSPDEGDAYIIGDSPTGDWAGRADCIAVYFGTAWVFLPGNDDEGDPIDMGARQTGLQVWVRDEGIPYVWGSEGGSPETFAWQPLAILPPAPIEIAGTSVTLTAAHNNRVLYLTASDPVTVTLPEEATEALDAGFVATLIKIGEGNISLAAEGDDELVTPEIGSPPVAVNTITERGGAAVVTLLRGPTGSPPASLWHAEGRLG